MGTFSPADLLDAYIAEREAARPARDNSKFHGSDYGKCMRYRVLKRAGKEHEEPSLVSKRRFTVGRIVEDVLLKAFAKGNVLSGSQTRVTSPDGEAIGHYDAIVDLGDELVLTDIKTCHSWKFDYLERGERDEAYRRQLGFYLWCLREGPLPEGVTRPTINRVCIVYVEKDTIRIFVDWFDPDQYVEAVKAEHAELLDRWQEFQTTGALPKELPFEREKDRYPSRRRYKTDNGEGLFPNWMCDPRYCGYHIHCPAIRAWWAANPREGDS